MSQTWTLIDDGRAVEIDSVVTEARVALSASDLESKLDWTLKPQGLCRGDVCVPVANPKALHSKHGIDLAEFARLLGRPLAIDFEERAAALAEAPTERSAALASLEAPDFTLPDIEGKLHSLSEHRGKKVLLIAYASW